MLTTGCAPTTAMSQVHKSYGIGFSMTDKKTSLTPRQATFKIDGNIFSPTINVENNMSSSNTYRIVFFLDYKQIHVEYRKHLMPLLDINTRGMESKSITVSVSNLKPGAHDLLCVLALNPQTSANGIAQPQAFQLVRRVTLLVNGNDRTNTSFFKIQNGNAPSEVPIDQPYITSERNGSLANSLVYSNAPKLYLHLHPTADTNYSLIVLQDYQQAQNALPYAFIHTIGSGLVTLPVHVPLHSNGLHDLEFMVVSHPFARVEDNSGNLHVPHFNWAPSFTHVYLETKQ